MFKITAEMHYRNSYAIPQINVVEKIVTVSDAQFKAMNEDLMKEFDFIAEHKAHQFQDDIGMHHCVLFIPQNGEDGLLVDCGEKNYAQYSSYIPQARKLAKSMLQEQIQYGKLMAETLKFYSPLKGEVYRKGEWGEQSEEAEELNGRELQKYRDVIAERVSHENRIESRAGLMDYFDDSPEIEMKVLSATPTVEVRNGELMGVMVCETIGEVTAEEIKNLKDYFRGQYSDGWGEGVEQRELEIDSGRYGSELYIHFWHSGDDYCIRTEQEQIKFENESLFEKYSTDGCKFYLSSGGIDRIYFNPDSNAGGQFVHDSISLGTLIEAFAKCKTEAEFWEHLDIHSKQYLTDIDTSEFKDALIDFAESPCDFEGETEETMETLRKWVQEQQQEQSQSQSMG